MKFTDWKKDAEASSERLRARQIEGQDEHLRLVNMAYREYWLPSGARITASYSPNHGLSVSCSQENRISELRTLGEGVANAIVIGFYDSWIAGGDPPPPSGQFDMSLTEGLVAQIRAVEAKVKR